MVEVEFIDRRLELEHILRIRNGIAQVQQVMVVSSAGQRISASWGDGVRRTVHSWRATSCTPRMRYRRRG